MNCAAVATGFIGSLKVKTTGVAPETPTARLAGTVETITGWAETQCEPTREDATIKNRAKRTPSGKGR
jgi:hypothetical protein